VDFGGDSFQALLAEVNPVTREYTPAGGLRKYGGQIQKFRAFIFSHPAGQIHVTVVHGQRFLHIPKFVVSDDMIGQPLGSRGRDQDRYRPIGADRVHHFLQVPDVIFRRNTYLQRFISIGWRAAF